MGAARTQQGVAPMVRLLPAEIEAARRAVVRQMMRRYRRDVDLDGEIAELRAGLVTMLRAECERLDYSADTLSRVMGVSAQWVSAVLSGSEAPGLDWLVIIARVIGYRVTLRLEPVDARALHDLRALADRIPRQRVEKLRRRVYKLAEDTAREAIRARYRRQPVYPSIEGSGIATAYASTTGPSSSSGAVDTVTSDASSSRSA